MEEQRQEMKSDTLESQAAFTADQAYVEFSNSISVSGRLDDSCVRRLREHGPSVTKAVLRTFMNEIGCGLDRDV